MRQESVIYLVLVLIILVSAVSSDAREDLVGLCYHRVEPVASGRFSISVAGFRQQLDYLHSRNFQSLNSDDLISYFEGNLNRTGSSSVIITFDDGFKTVYDFAFPIMEEYGFKGIVCIYPAFIGSRNAISWAQLKELSDAGWSIESHSMTHANLTDTKQTEQATQQFLDKEIVQSKNLIEQKLNTKVRFMVWPYGCYSKKTLTLARKAGYEGALTVDSGASSLQTSKWFIKRQVIYSSDGLNKFLIRLGMRALPLEDRFPAPGAIIGSLDKFRARFVDVKDYNPEKYVLNVKVTGRKTNFSFNNKTGYVTGTISRPLSAGNYYMDFYLRERSTGITRQNGWLFSIADVDKKEFFAPKSYRTLSN